MTWISDTLVLKSDKLLAFSTAPDLILIRKEGRSPVVVKEGNKGADAYLQTDFSTFIE